MIDQSSSKRCLLEIKADKRTSFLIDYGLLLTSRCRMDEENTLVVQAAYTQSPLNEGNLSAVFFFR